MLVRIGPFNSKKKIKIQSHMPNTIAVLMKANKGCEDSNFDES